MARPTRKKAMGRPSCRSFESPKAKCPPSSPGKSYRLSCLPDRSGGQKWSNPRRSKRISRRSILLGRSPRAAAVESRMIRVEAIAADHCGGERRYGDQQQKSEMASERTHGVMDDKQIGS